MRADEIFDVLKIMGFDNNSQALQTWPSSYEVILRLSDGSWEDFSFYQRHG